MRRLICLAGALALAAALSAGRRGAMSFTLTSSAFKEGGFIPERYTCWGEDESPPLHWGATPLGCRSVAVVMEDPDAPGGTWVHWVLWDVPPMSTGLEPAQPPQAELPGGAHQGLASGVHRFSRLGYSGPCPPSGTHRYYFRAYALDKKLGLLPKGDVFALRRAMEGHILAEAELMGRVEHRD